jgi:hypothetical protein
LNGERIEALEKECRELRERLAALEALVKRLADTTPRLVTYNGEPMA